MIDDLTNQEQVTYFFPGADTITIAAPMSLNISSKDGQQYHIVKAMDGSTVIMSPKWLAIRLVPRATQETIH